MVDVVLPCLNEAPALPAVLARMPEGYRPIVVDNGSTDGTADVARERAVQVVQASPPGYGAAVHAGLLACSEGVVCVMDADGSMDPAQLPLLADLVLHGRAQLAVGRRRPVSPGAWPLHARAANLLLSGRLRRCSGLSVHDIGPVRAARRSDLLSLDVRDRRFGYPLELLIKAGQAGWDVAEVDIAYRPRAAGTRSKVSGSVRGTLRAVHDMRAVLAQ